MARWTFAILALSVAVGQFGVNAAPTGNLKCNAARLKVVTSLKAASKLVDTMVDNTVDSQDPAVHTAITDAQTGLSDATTAVQGIADALQAKQDPPQELRDQTLAGLNAAKTALAQFASSNSADASSLTSAQKNVDDALAAGQQVVDSCGGGADSSTATNGSAAKRQIGGLACNIARLQTVTNLAKSTSAVKKLAAAATNDATAADAATQATTGLGDAKAGIAQIAAVLLTGGQAPADARTQVESGLTAAKTALAAANSTDPTVVDALAAATKAVDDTITAGGKVVSSC